MERRAKGGKKMEIRKSPDSSSKRCPSDGQLRSIFRHFNRKSLHKLRGFDKCKEEDREVL